MFRTSRGSFRAFDLFAGPPRPRDAVPSSPSSPFLYRRLLGAHAEQLDRAIWDCHFQGEAVVCSGQLRVTRGASRILRGMGRALRLPGQGESVRAVLRVSREGTAERWTRNFAGSTLSSLQRAGPDGLLEEQFFLVVLQFRLRVQDGGLKYEHVGTRINGKRCGIHLPALLAPRIRAFERPVGGRRVRVGVRVDVPVLGTLLAYEGDIEPERRCK